MDKTVGKLASWRLCTWTNSFRLAPTISQNIQGFTYSGEGSIHESVSTYGKSSLVEVCSCFFCFLVATANEFTCIPTLCAFAERAEYKPVLVSLERAVWKCQFRQSVAHSRLIFCKYTHCVKLVSLCSCGLTKYSVVSVSSSWFCRLTISAKCEQHILTTWMWQTVWVRGNNCNDVAWVFARLVGKLCVTFF